MADQNVVNMEKAKKITLTDIADYVTNTVVSQTLLRNDAGNVTFFSFAEGQGLSAHSAPFDAFVHVLEGEGTIIIDNQEHLLMAGQAILMPADIQHAVRADKDFKMLLVMLKG